MNRPPLERDLGLQRLKIRPFVGQVIRNFTKKIKTVVPYTFFKKRFLMGVNMANLVFSDFAMSNGQVIDFLLHRPIFLGNIFRII